MKYYYFGINLKKFFFPLQLVLTGWGTGELDEFKTDHILNNFFCIFPSIKQIGYVLLYKKEFILLNPNCNLFFT